MADTTITALPTALTGANTAADDLYVLDDTDAVATKKQRADELCAMYIAVITTALAGAGMHATQDKIPIYDNGVPKYALVTEVLIGAVALSTAIDTGYHATEDLIPYIDNGVASKITVPNLLEALLALNTTALTGANVHATQDTLIISDNGVPSSITSTELCNIYPAVITTALAGSGAHATQDKIPIYDNGVAKHILVPEIFNALIATVTTAQTGAGVAATDTLYTGDGAVGKSITFTELISAISLLGVTLADIPEYADQAAAQVGLSGTGKLWWQTATGLLGVTIA